MKRRLLSFKTRYRRARKFEIFIRDRLRECGFLVLDLDFWTGPVDLIAIDFKNRAVYFIECKSGRGGLSRDKRIRISKFIEQFSKIMDKSWSSQFILLTKSNWSRVLSDIV